MENWKKLLRQMKLEYFKRTAPNFFEMSGGYQMKTMPYNDTTSNGLTKCICDFITYSGGSATRINTTGTMRKINGKMKWTHGSTRKGTADINAVFKGRFMAIEIKIGKDKMSEHQIQEQQRIEGAGGLYFVARSFPEFLDWWKKIGAPVSARG